MQYYFSNYFLKNPYRHQTLIILFLIIFVGSSFPVFSWASSPLDTTLVIEKDIYPKIVDRQERLIEGKKYVFATINERKGMVALSGNFLSEMAHAAGIEVTDFLDWNDMKPTDAIKTGQVYYLQEKGNRAKDVATHVLMDKETLWDVSQKYAMRYKYLLKYNRLDEDDKVKVGRVLWIQTKRPKRIPVEVRDVTPIVASFDESEEEETAADPELMAEWEELKKTELAGVDNNEKNNATTTTVVKTENNNPTKTTTSEQGSFAEFDNDKGTDGVIITEKTDAKKNAETTTTNVVKYHTVAEAESLYDISKKYNVVMSKLKEWNNLPDYTTYTGQKLIVSQPNISKEDKVYEGSLVTEKTDTKTTNSSDKKVVVKQNANGEFVTFLDSSGVLLPTPQQDFRPVEPSLTTKNSDYHIVEKDETLWSIARKYNLNPKDVIRWNGFIVGDNIDVGDKIILKSSLAVPAGSRVEIEKNNSTNNSSGNNATAAGGSEFKDPTLIDPAISNGVNQVNTGSSQVKTNPSTLTREEIIKIGGNPDKAGTKGYDAMGFEVAMVNTDTIKTKIEEIETKAEIYVVKPQDMLGKIAQKFNITTKEMMAWNPKIPANGTIYKGDTLFVSKPKTTVTVVEETKNQATATVYPVEYYGAGFHAVQPNENVYNLSEKYGVPVANIWKWNKLETTVIDLPVGKKMIVNEGVLQMANNDTAISSQTKQNITTDATTRVNYDYHSVAKGETLFSIAQKYNLSTAQVREWNNRQGDLVYEGEKLIIGIK
ncbi:LysM peptidoglycan-binding domain-containing protein [Bernardetia sp. Wsw4-3y2]|uniref:LysM peptidoglycan-binding domain-containing protein n=1 Tax=Bernardetia sp. Wsw4-3y2 TaxID=3127471 RepID=UPI0030CADF95